MILLYFKQAWNLLKQEKLFSSIYVIGTGLSITVVMVLSIVYYIKVANIYPETNRDRILIIKSAMEKRNDGDTWSSNISPQFVDECIRPVEGFEAISLMMDSGDENYVQPVGSKDQMQVIVKYVDCPFWTVYPFHFIHGNSFSEADFNSGIATSVISASTAKRVFGRTDVVGEYISLDFRQFRVCGVVKDASFVTERTYANLWVPYTIKSYYKKGSGLSGFLGNMEAILLAPSVDDVSSLKQKTIESVERYTRSAEGYTFSINGQPDRHWESTFRFWSNVGPDFKGIALKYGAIFLILLLVPAVSLSGMTDSRMERRLAEMGIRRAFGAPVNNLMRQIISENFLFTLLGGLAGLLFSYFLILLSSDWIMSIGQEMMDLPPEGTNVFFTPSMLMNLPVFVIALSVCFILNLLTALIPAWRASHKQIIYSLNATQ